MRFFLLIASMVQCSGTIETNDILENGEKFLNKLGGLTTVGLDLMGQLEIITHRTAEAAKLIHPASALMITIAQTVIKADSEEAQMLRKIDHKLTAMNAELAHVIYDNLHLAVSNAQGTSYMLQVNVSLNSIRRDLKYALGGTFPAATEDFRKACSNRLESPWKILDRIERFISCSRTPEKSVDIYLGFKNLSQTLFKSTAPLEDTIIFYETHGLGRQYSRITALDDAASLVFKISQEVEEKSISFQSIEEAGQYIDGKIAADSSPVNKRDIGGCLIDNLISTNGWNTNNALGLGIFFEKDINTAFLIGGFCAGTFTDPVERNAKESDLINIFTRLTKSAGNRVLSLLAASWPKIELRAMKTMMNAMSFNDAKKDAFLQTEANRLWETLNAMGPQGYSKQVIITAFGPTEGTYTLKCEAKFCISYNSSTNEDGSAGLSAVVVRTPMTGSSGFFIRETAKWVEENREKIEGKLREGTDSYSNDYTINKIVQEVGPLMQTENSFGPGSPGHGFLLIRDIPYWATNCVNWYSGIASGKLPLHSNETFNKWRHGVTSISDYYTGGLFSNVVCWSLHIFA